MSLSGAHRAAFRREAPREGRVYSIRDAGGFPVATGDDGAGALPFWSKLSRAQKVVAQVEVYRDFDIVEIELRDWISRWLPGLERGGYLIGVNWAGPRATGYDESPRRVAEWFADSDEPGDEEAAQSEPGAEASAGVGKGAEASGQGGQALGAPRGVDR